MYSFNTPDEFADILPDAGFGFVSTANNHCLDRGTAGLYRTLDVLDRVGIGHTGVRTFLDLSADADVALQAEYGLPPKK